MAKALQIPNSSGKMRFSLLTLLAFVTLVGGCLAMIVEHWWFGIALFLPHLLAVSTIALLAHRDFRRAAAVVGAAYVACWAFTFFVDAPRVREEDCSRVEKNLSRYGHDELRRLDYNPPMWPSAPDIDMPWYFVGNESSPCPLIVTVDYGVMFGATNGGGGRGYFLCFCGYSRVIHFQMHWAS